MKSLLATTALAAALTLSVPAFAANTALIMWNDANPGGFESALGTGSADLTATNLDGVTVTLSFVNRGTNPNQLTEGNINIDNTTSTVQTLSIIAGANGFLGPSAHFALTGGIVGTNGSSDLLGAFFVDAGNVLNGTSFGISGNEINAFNSGLLTGVDSFAFNGAGFDLVSGPYGMAERLDITLQPFSGVAVQALSMEATAVPEPRTWAMLLGGFALMGLMGWRRSKTPRLALDA